MEERRYYICCVKLNHSNIYLIWYSDESDGIVLGEDKKLLTFSNQKLLRSFAEKQKIKLQKVGAALHNMDIVQTWLWNPTRRIDCFEFLLAWNLFTDVSTSLNENFKGNRKSIIRNMVYDKLFFGNNLPSITPVGKKYFPKWSLIEIAVLSSILKDGLRILKNNLNH
jgi:hypothetical protein